MWPDLTEDKYLVSCDKSFPTILWFMQFINKWLVLSSQVLIERTNTFPTSCISFCLRRLKAKTHTLNSTPLKKHWFTVAAALPDSREVELWRHLLFYCHCYRLLLIWASLIKSRDKWGGTDCWGREIFNPKSCHYKDHGKKILLGDLFTYIRFNGGTSVCVAVFLCFDLYSHSYPYITLSWWDIAGGKKWFPYSGL